MWDLFERGNCTFGQPVTEVLGAGAKRLSWRYLNSLGASSSSLVGDSKRWQNTWHHEGKWGRRKEVNTEKHSCRVHVSPTVYQMRDSPHENPSARVQRLLRLHEKVIKSAWCNNMGLFCKKISLAVAQQE